MIEVFPKLVGDKWVPYTLTLGHENPGGGRLNSGDVFITQWEYASKEACQKVCDQLQAEINRRRKKKK